METLNYGISNSLGENSQKTFLYQIIYPHDFKLKPITNIKRGRPKKSQCAKKSENTEIACSPSLPTKASRTRSGRIVKLPKYMEKDFKKIEISDEPEVKTTEFIRPLDEKVIKRSDDVALEFHQKKRVVSAHYRCPKCKKAYLGKNKMIQHIKKNPDHGPLPEGYPKLNFDVWNYLVDITQKCPPGQRGLKFCEELTNLLHNVQLLTGALFKNLNQEKNPVNIDKVLGNAIGLSPGKYSFDENELYKDVTVLKLITNNQFFNPNLVNKVVSYRKYEEEGFEAKSKKKVNEAFYFSEDKILCSTSQFENSNKPAKNSPDLNNCTDMCKCKSSKVGISSKKVTSNSTQHNIENLLVENTLLNDLPHLRNSVDELILNTDTASSILENSTSSDEVMNVDQFVNERFKKLIEPDIEISESSLNLVDLPTLDLFQFPTS